MPQYSKPSALAEVFMNCVFFSISNSQNENANYLAFNDEDRLLFISSLDEA